MAAGRDSPLAIDWVSWEIAVKLCRPLARSEIGEAWLGRVHPLRNFHRRTRHRGPGQSALGPAFKSAAQAQGPPPPPILNTWLSPSCAQICFCHTGHKNSSKGSPAGAAGSQPVARARALRRQVLSSVGCALGRSREPRRGSAEQRPEFFGAHPVASHHQLDDGVGHEFVDGRFAVKPGRCIGQGRLLGIAYRTDRTFLLRCVV